MSAKLIRLRHVKFVPCKRRRRMCNFVGQDTVLVGGLRVSLVGTVRGALWPSAVLECLIACREREREKIVHWAGLG